MKLAQILLGSYRSFNYDFKRKFATNNTDFPTCKDPWDIADSYEAWRPLVNTPISYPISCVVGLNGSGKSFLIEGARKLLLGDDFVLADVCRYSLECRIESIDQLGYPKAGLVWDQLTPQFINAINLLPVVAVNPVPEDAKGSFVVLRREPNKAQLLFLSSERKTTHAFTVSLEDFTKVCSHLPRPVHISTRVFLPSSVSMKSLFKYALEELNDGIAINEFINSHPHYKPFANSNEVNSHPADESQRLVFRLLKHCANIDCKALYQICSAPEELRKEFSAQAGARAEELLNLSHWWGQDVDAQLSIDLRKEDVAIHLTDRTGSWYGFSERSQGMKYFLGYILQILLELKSDSRPLLILSDEPDFALSAVGQRDLMRFFKEVVSWGRTGGGSQLIFTTHSAELIDPNFPNRVTILRKGTFDEGTMVMARAHHKLFEPVRSALGSRSSSFPFIDAPNLIVEGLSDRAFIVRMSQYFASKGDPHLDLAYLSIVVAEGADRVPRIALTAKSVAGDRAYITVLLDNDSRGRKAAEMTKEQDRYLVDTKQIIMTDDILGPGLGKDCEIEDVIPPSLYYRAFSDVMKTTLAAEVFGKLPGIEEIVTKVALSPIVDAMESVRKTILPEGDDHTYDKEAVINRVFDIVEEGAAGATLAEFENNLKKATVMLLDRINVNLRDKRHKEVSRAMNHMIRDFLHFNRLNIFKSRAEELLTHVRELGNRVSAPGMFDTQVDKVLSDFAIRQGLRTDVVKDHAAFSNRLRQLPQTLGIDSTLSLM